MSSQGFRIPRMAAALLVLGGASCDDEKTGSGTPGSGAAGTDTSNARIRRVSREVCAKQESCGWAEADGEEPLTVSQCTEQLIQDFTSGAFSDAGGAPCIDAYLDLYECYVEAACEDEDDCNALLEAAYSQCDFD
jgi:hypothetical protein